MSMEAIAQAVSASAPNSTEVRKTSKGNYGKTIGSPELSEKAQKYYEKLKKKYSHMDFILVSEDKKAEAQAQAGKYANANRMVVLIDTEKVEKMAEDEAYRKKYESVISGAATQLGQLKTQLGSSGASVKTFGMKFDDGGNASFFAVIDKSLSSQKKRIEKNAQKKAEEKKKTEKEAREKRSEKLKEGKEADKSQKTDGDYVTVTASSIDELMKKIKDVMYGAMSDQARTEEEKKIGQGFDFTI